MQGTEMQPALRQMMEDQFGILTSPSDPKKAPFGAGPSTPASQLFEGRDTRSSGYTQTEGLQAVEAAQLSDESKTEQRRKVAEVGFWEGVGHSAYTTTTAYMFRAISPYMDGSIEPPIEGYKLSLDDYYGLVKEHGLSTTQHNRNRLMSANSPAQALRYAQDLKRVQDTQELVADRWVTNLVVHTLDPVENAAMLGAAALTGGVGGFAGLSARVTRVASAVNQTMALSGAMYAGAQSGAQYNTQHILLAASMAFPLSYLGTRGMHAQFAARVERKAAARAAERGGERIEPTVGQVSTQRAAEAVDTVAAGQFRTQLQAARNAVRQAADAVRVASGKAAWQAHLPANIRTTLTNLPLMRQDIQNEIMQLRQAIKDAGGASKAAPKQVQRLQELRTELRNMDAPESIAVSRYADVTPGQYNAAVADAKAAAKTELAEAQAELAKHQDDLKTVEAQEVPTNIVEQGINDTDAALAAASPEGSKSAAAHLQDAERQLQDIGVSAEDSQRLANAAMQVAATQAGSNVTRPGFLYRAFQGFTNLVSEHAKVTAGIPALEKFVSRTLDDPLQRTGLIGDTAASNFAVYTRQASRDMQAWETGLHDVVHEKLGRSQWSTFFGYESKFVEARLAMEDMVASDLLRRESQVLRGETPTASPDASIAKLTQLAEDLHHNAAERARVAGLVGFEDYMRTAGYFHRAWNWDKMARILSSENPNVLHEGLAAGIMRANKFLTLEEATSMAKAITTRAQNKAQNARTDAMGQVGALELDSMRQMLAESGASAEAADSLMRRLEQNLTEQGSVKYAKRRIPIDMTLEFKGEAGRYRLQDLIDTDMSRLMQNYSRGMAGRSALAKVGIGGDTHGIQTHLQHYAKALDAQPQLTRKQKDSMYETYSNLMGDFTGVRKDGQVLGETMQILKATTAASMLGSTGLLQIPEGSIAASRHGFITTSKHFLKEMPGIKQLLGDVARDKQLLENWFEVTNIDFKTDLRLESWKRQVEMGFPSDGTGIRIATAMQRMTPSVTGQRWVHAMQSDGLLKLNLHTLYKASVGDTKALKLISEAGDNLTPDMLKQIKDAATVTDGKLTSLNLERLPHRTLDAVMQQMTRLQDSLLLHHRPGWGASYRHSAVGQILGQFTSYVSMAHNVIMRRTWEHEGALGIAKVLAYQYPVMLMTSYLNEARKGNILDLDNEDDIKKLAKTALGYSAVVGMYGDLFGTITGSGSRSVAAAGPTEAPGKVWAALGHVANGDFGTAAGETLGALRATSLLGAVAGSQLLEKALKEQHPQSDF